MARYTQESREKVRDSVDFAELVGARTELKRAGANRLQGLCPFHEERFKPHAAAEAWRRTLNWFDDADTHRHGGHDRHD